MKSTVFVPPYGSFNRDTLEAAKQTGVVYFSASVRNDPPPFESDTLRHVPSTLMFEELAVNDPFLTGTLQQKALAKVKASIKQYGFAVVSLHPPDLAVRDTEYKNEVDAAKLKLLETLIDDIKSSGINLVTMPRVHSILEEQSIVVPEWVKDNARWWSEGNVTDSDFTEGIEYLIEQKIVKIPDPQTGTGTAEIPSWVKNNAGWWAEGKIGNSDFVKGIQYLIERGIIRV